MSIIYGRNLTNRQQTFLRAMRDEALTLEELAAKCDVPGHLLARWLRHPGFRAALKAVLTEHKRKGTVGLRMLAAWAAKQLARIVAGDAKATEAQVLACRAAIELGTRPAPRRRGRPPGARGATHAPEPTPYHPSLSPKQVNDLLREWRARETARAAARKALANANPAPDVPRASILPADQA